MTTYAIYISQSGLANLRIGLESGVWGWKQNAFDRSNNAAVIRSMKTGDLVVMAQGGSSPRVAPLGWTSTHMAGVDVCEVVRGSYRSTSHVWSDGIYPERIGIEFVASIEPSVDLGTETLEALRRSGTRLGVPVEVSPINPNWWRNQVGQDDDHLLGLPANLDGVARRRVRREQRLIRRWKFGTAPSISCNLCGRLLPRQLVRAAHIKRRADADDVERRDLNNVMAACLLGCDELFEQGLIMVAPDGIMEADTLAYTTADLQTVLMALDGHPCDAFTPASGPFFASHRLGHGH